MKSVRLLCLFVFSLLIISALTFSLPHARAKASLGPLDLSGDLHGAPYRIRVPEPWNGTLLVYVHGYRDKADHPGEVDNRNADIAPNAALEAALLAQGYALAGSAFKDNGWAVEEGLQDTKNLAVFFKTHVAKPDQTIIWAFSLGTFIGFESMEQFGGIFDGALCSCAAGAGATRIWDNGLALMLAYDVVFGVPGSWGTVREVRNNIDFETEVVPVLVPQLANAANFPKFEFVRLVSGVPGQGISPPFNPMLLYPNWILTDLFFLTEGRAELQRRAGGPYCQNLDQNYTLTAAERAYLIALGLPAPVIDGWLAQMNGRRNIEADQSARNYVAHNDTYKGDIKHPVLTLHTILDPLVVVANESAYKELIVSRGRQDQLFQTYTGGNGHCAFTGPQLLTAINAIDVWVRTGVAPTDANFPAALGFLPGFVPPNLPQP